MAQQQSTAMASSRSADISAERSTSPPPQTQQTLALIPASSSAITALAPATVPSMGITTSQHPPPAPAPHNVQEGEDAWSVVTRSLMVAVMGSQPPASAASTLLGIFRPMVDGWAGARKEGKRWKERAEVYMADHHKHKMELAHKHDTLQTQVEGLQKSLADSQGRAGELECEVATLRSNVSSMESKLGEAEAQARATKEAHAEEAQKSKREAEAMAKRAEEAKLLHENLRREADDKTRAYNREVVKLQDKIREVEAVKSKLEEQLGLTIAKSTSLEADLTQKAQEIANLQTRVTELTSRKDALERQLALYQRMPTRRF